MSAFTVGKQTAKMIDPGRPKQGHQYGPRERPWPRLLSNGYRVTPSFCIPHYWRWAPSRTRCRRKLLKTKLWSGSTSRVGSGSPSPLLP